VPERLEPFVCEIPPGLAWADETLERFGRWATSRGRGARTCGSAEGQYRAPSRDEAPPAPTGLGMSTSEAMAAHRALQAVPELQRTVLRILYVPERRPVEALLRSQGIPPRLCRIRHAEGLQMFANLHRLHVRPG